MQLGTGLLFAGRFEIARVIGIGGMGAVYRARDHYTDSWVALKLLHPAYSHFEDTERFTREAQILSELTHPGIVNYVAHGKTVDGQHYLAMEWLDGIVLSNRLSQGPLHVRDAIRLLRSICQTLSTVHEKGIIHRDIKIGIFPSLKN